MFGIASVFSKSPSVQVDDCLTRGDDVCDTTAYDARASAEDGLSGLVVVDQRA